MVTYLGKGRIAPLYSLNNLVQTTGTSEDDVMSQDSVTKELNKKSDKGHTHTSTEVGLSNVDNTSDLNKPISTATQTALNLKEDKANKGIANGYASLDSNGKVTMSQINDSLIGNVNYKGLWNPSTNTPNLDTVASKGNYYICNSSATRYGIDWANGDWIISDGTSWTKVDNTDAVSSVAGRTGNVTLTKSDVGLSNVPNLDTTNAVNHTSRTDNPHGVTAAQAGAISNADGNIYTGISTTLPESAIVFKNPNDKQIISVIGGTDKFPYLFNPRTTQYLKLCDDGNLRLGVGNNTSGKVFWNSDHFNVSELAERYTVVARNVNGDVHANAYSDELIVEDTVPVKSFVFKMPNDNYHRNMSIARTNAVLSTLNNLNTPNGHYMANEFINVPLWYGLFNNQNNSSFRANGDYFGTWNIQGYKNGYCGLNIGSNDCVFMTNGDASGLYNAKSTYWIIRNVNSENITYFDRAIKVPNVAFTSDIRKKENISILDETRQKLQPKWYNLIDDESKKITLGYIAQEIEEIYPEFVSTDTSEEGIKSLDYRALHTAEIYRLTKENEDLKSRIEKLENILNKAIEDGKL